MDAQATYDDTYPVFVGISFDDDFQTASISVHTNGEDVDDDEYVIWSNDGTDLDEFEYEFYKYDIDDYANVLNVSIDTIIDELIDYYDIEDEEEIDTLSDREIYECLWYVYEDDLKEHLSSTIEADRNSFVTWAKDLFDEFMENELPDYL